MFALKGASPMDRTVSYYDLIEAFAKEGCPVCRLGLAAVHRYLEAVNYESAGDPGIRGQLRASLGFCNVHAHQWLGLAHVLGTAAIYVDVLTQLAADLQALSFHSHTLLAGVAALFDPRADRGSDPGLLVPTGQCPACQNWATTEEMVIRTLLSTLLEPAFREAYAGSAGMCLPHLRHALTEAGDEATFAMLRDAAAAQEQRLLTQLREIIRRSDYRFVDEPVGAERGAAERAVYHVVGAPGIPRSGIPR